MDIVLEVFDTFFFDCLYASFLPKSSVFYGQTPPKNASATFTSMREVPTAIHASSSQFFQLAPSRYAYMSAWPRDNVWRQTLTLYLITWSVFLGSCSFQTLTDGFHRLFGFIVYFVCASLSYVFVFDHATFTHPKYLKNQVRLEIRQSLIAMPLMAIFTAPFFVGEVRGYAKLYDAPSDAPFSLYNYIQIPFFVAFTDFFIYWIHRGLHHPRVYKVLHKPHHKWIMPTPYASHAFHPLDGFVQSVPYHVFPFLFPLQKFAYIALFIFINIWTVFIRKLSISAFITPTADAHVPQMMENTWPTQESSMARPATPCTTYISTTTMGNSQHCGIVSGAHTASQMMSSSTDSRK